MTHPMIQKIASQIPEHIPGDDKTNLNNYLYDLELSDDEPGISVIKIYAIDNLGRMALRYDANLLIICGVLPHIKKALMNKNDHVIAATARTCGCIARSGGAQVLLDEDFSRILMSVATDLKKNFYVRDACARAFGWLHVMRELESKH
jgi:hypothetical protein